MVVKPITALRTHDAWAVRVLEPPAVEAGEGVGLPEWVAIAKGTLAWLAFQEGRHDEVLALAAECDELMKKPRDREIFLNWVRLWPVADVGAGRPKPAVTAARQPWPASCGTSDRPPTLVHQGTVQINWTSCAGVPNSSTLRRRVRDSASLWVVRTYAQVVRNRVQNNDVTARGPACRTCAKFPRELRSTTPRVDTDLDTKEAVTAWTGPEWIGQAGHRNPDQRDKSTKAPTLRTVPVNLRC